MIEYALGAVGLSAIPIAQAAASGAARRYKGGPNQDSSTPTL
jgi:hypothetical protein